MNAEFITIEEAFLVAKRRIKWPSMAVMFAPRLAYIVAAKLSAVPRVGYAGTPWFIASFLGGFLGGWIVWSVRVPQWMLWAYPRVHNVAELKQRAIQEQLLWPDASVFNRTLIMSAAERRKIREFEHKGTGRRNTPTPNLD